MPVTPEDLLDSALKMCEGGEEVDWRNAISRAYYAAFHKCRNLAGAVEPRAELSSGTAHRDVQDILIAHRPTKGIAYRLRDLAKERRLADYELSESFSQAGSRTAVANCTRILKGVEDARAEAPA